MHLLVTGGAGFIGSHFVLRHCEKHPRDRMTVLDALTYAGDKSFLDPVMSAIAFVQGDIVDQSLVSKLVREQGIDTIVNFAAESHVDNSIADAAPFLRTNVIGTQSLIEVLKEHPAVRMLHISTDEVYGDIEDGDAPRKVSDLLLPSSPYAASKAAAEMLIMASMRTFQLKICVTRCTNNYGPHQADEKFIPTVIRHALCEEPVPVYGDGRNKRDWLYVTDHCDVLEIILKTTWTMDEGHIFNIGMGHERENLAVAKIILDLLGKPHSLITFVKDRPGHDWRYALDASPTRALGWEPTVPFEEGIQKTIEWYRARMKN